MTDAIIVILLVAAVLLGGGTAVKHFKGQGGCCGGGDYRPKRKRLANVKYQRKFKVDGMHCEHCRTRVEELVNDIEGLSGRVDLKRGVLTVSYAEEVDDELLRTRIEHAGYILVGRVE